MIEELIIQDERMMELNPDSINTIRIVTISNGKKSAILASFLRIGNSGNFVDNFNGGRMTVSIDLSTGKICFPAYDKKGNLYKKHPIINTEIVGFQIPDWYQILELSNKLALSYEELKMIGWDLCLSNKGPLVVEGNEYPGHDIYQLPSHRNGNVGLLPQFEKALEEIGLSYEKIKSNI